MVEVGRVTSRKLLVLTSWHLSSEGHTGSGILSNETGEIYEQSDEQFTISSEGEMIMKSKRELKTQLTKQFAQEKQIARFNENDI